MSIGNLGMALAGLALLAIGGCGIVVKEETSTGAGGPQAKQTREVGTFSKLRLEGAANVVYKQGAPTALTVEGSQLAVENTTTVVTADTLVIGKKRNLSNAGKLTVTIVGPRITSVELTGAGNISATGLDVPSLDVSLSGAGNAEFSGKATALKVSLGGVGNVDTKNLTAESATVRLSGAGNAEVFASKSVDLDVSGAGNVTYFGHPATVNKTTTGVGRVGAG